MKDIIGREIKQHDLIAISYGNYLQLGIFKRDTGASLQYYPLNDWGVSRASKPKKYSSFINTYNYKRLVLLDVNYLDGAEKSYYEQIMKAVR